MNSAETVAKLEAMRQQVAEMRETSSDYDTITLAKAVDALTYVVIDQLRLAPSRVVEVDRIHDDHVTLIINGQPWVLSRGDSVTLP